MTTIDHALEHVRHLLPAQGPIKDFIHHNTLHAFQHLSFDKAVLEAGEFYGAHAYMPLEFYRQELRKQKISTSKLDACVAKSALCEHPFVFLTGMHSTELIRHALYQYIEILDKNAFLTLIKNKRISEEAASQSSQILHESLPPLHFNTTFLRCYCQEQLGENCDLAINPILFRLVSSFLDQGIELWQASDQNLPFYSWIKEIAQTSIFPLVSFVPKRNLLKWLSLSSDEVIEKLLALIVGDEEDYTRYIEETLMAHPGWSGMVNVIETKPSSLLKPRQISLKDFLAIKLILEWELICSRHIQFIPISHFKYSNNERSQREQSRAYSLTYLLLSFGISPDDFPSFKNSNQLLRLLSEITTQSLSSIWHNAFEDTYYNHVLSSIQSHLPALAEAKSDQPFVQAVFCIDDRECSFRRYLEEADPHIETFATAGFFAIDFYFQSLNDCQPIKLCPVPVDPQYVVKEIPKEEHLSEFERQKILSQKTAISLQWWQDASSSMLMGFIAANTLGHLSIARLAYCLFRPAKLIKSLVTRKIDIPTQLSLVRNEGLVETTPLHHGFTYDEMANRVYANLTGIGLVSNFAPIVTFIAHGSSSINNPHFAAYDCGACSGKPGAPNARAIAMMANMPEVRKRIAEKGVIIPDDTVFIGGYHDTCTDSVIFFDTHQLSGKHLEIFTKLQATVNHARMLNAKERCRRFALVDMDISPSDALKEAQHRAMALFEPRPELGHATNTLCIIGQRKTTKGLFFDRRAFFNSYDPSIDSTGEVLNKILSAVIPVCGGINLEYYFSRVDSGVYGCGTKLSHNVCGLLGVYNGIDDDLRTGLPVQMTEIHDPIRLLTIVEQAPHIVKQVLESNPAVKEWIDNEWVKFACLDPITHEIWMYYPHAEFGLLRLDPIQLQRFATSQDIAQQSRENIAVTEIAL